MAFFIWAPNGILTKDCDKDVADYCLAARPNMASRPGAVGSCLANIVSAVALLTARTAPPCPPRRLPIL